MTGDDYRPIADYAFLSDCHSTALVSSHGSIDWACLRRFDAGSAFARLLDVRRGGAFSIRPVAEITEVHRRYLPGTLVLETTMSTDAGAVRCTDAFTMSSGGSADPRNELVRVVEAVDRPVEVEVVVEPRFDYGDTRPWMRRHADGRVTAVGGDDALVIDTDVDLDIDREASRLHARVTIEPGAARVCSVVAVPAHLVDTALADRQSARVHLAETVDWWVDWSDATDATGPHADLLARSAMVLKGLTCAPTGAIIAAPTTSLPEVVGGSDNWDYRYSWVRDSTLALSALADVGHHDVAQGFRDFVMRSSAGHGDELQIMYGPYGQRRLPELELDLEGWRGSSPVRIGNGAVRQVQLDLYGHLLDAVQLWHGRKDDIDDDEWSFLRSVVDQAMARRNDTDSGIWELRGPPQHFVESKVMVWVALDRGIRLVEDHGFDDVSVDEWRQARDEVRHDVLTRGVDPDRGNFVQHYGTTAVDASLLKLVLVGFVEADDERMRITTDVIMDELGVAPHGFLRRYATEADAREGVFLLCSCWLVEVLALQGRTDEATALFDALETTGNDLGLFAEEYDAGADELLGNFPQAFTHLGMVAAARRLHTVSTR